jgi:hypothetical protein
MKPMRRAGFINRLLQIVAAILIRCINRSQTSTGEPAVAC